MFVAYIWSDFTVMELILWLLRIQIKMIEIKTFFLSTSGAMGKNIVTEPNILLTRGSSFTPGNTNPWRAPDAFH